MDHTNDVVDIMMKEVEAGPKQCHVEKITSGQPGEEAPVPPTP